MIIDRRKNLVKGISFLLAFVLVYQDMAAAGGNSFLSPGSTGGQIAQLLPGNLNRAWKRFQESPSALTLREASKLIKFLRTHPNLYEGARGVCDNLLAISRLRIEVDTETGIKMVLDMIENNRFIDINFRPSPFRMRASGSIKAGCLSFNRRVRLVEQEFVPSAEYMIDFYPSKRIQEWVGIVYEISEKGIIAKDPLLVFFGSPVNGKIRLNKLQRFELEQLLEEVKANPQGEIVPLRAIEKPRAKSRKTDWKMKRRLSSWERYQKGLLETIYETLKEAVEAGEADLEDTDDLIDYVQRRLPWARKRDISEQIYRLREEIEEDIRPHKLMKPVKPVKRIRSETLRLIGWFIFVGACLAAALWRPELWPLFLLAVGMAGWGNGDSQEKGNQLQLILNCVLEDGPVPEPHEGFVKNGKLFLIDHKRLVITLSHLKGYDGRVWVSYKREGDNLYAFVWEQRGTMEKSSGAGGYINKYYLIKGGEVLAQWVNGIPTGRYPRKAAAPGERKKWDRRRDVEQRREKRMERRSGVNYTELSAGEITEEIASLMQAEMDNTQTIPPPVQDEDELSDRIDSPAITDDRVLKALSAFSVYGNQTVMEKAMALYHRFKGLFISGSPMIMDMGERIVQPDDVHELIQNGNIDFEGAVSIKVDTLPQRMIGLKESLFNPSLILTLLMVPLFYPIALILTIFFFHINHLLIDAQISGKISYKDNINIGKYIKISSIRDFLGILIGYIKTDSNDIGPISDWAYSKIRIRNYSYFYIIFLIMFVSGLITPSGLAVTLVANMAACLYFEFRNLRRPKIDIGKGITIEGKDAFSSALADAWDVYFGKAGSIDRTARDEFISLVLDSDDNRIAPIIVAKIKGLPLPARIFVELHELDRKTREILRKKGIYYERGLTVLGMDSEFVDAIMANMSEETARGYLWLLAERVFGHELAEKTPHTLEHEIRIQRFNRRMNRVMLRDGSIYYPVYDVTHKDMGGVQWQDRFRTRRHFKWLRGRGPAGRYVKKAMEQINFPAGAPDNAYVLPKLKISREKFHEIYVELAGRIREIYPYWILYSEDMLYNTIVSNGPDYGWYGLICAMRKEDGKADNDDFYAIARMAEIVDFAPPELKPLLTAELARDYLKKDMFVDIESQLKRLGYGNEAGEIIDPLMQIVKTMAWNDNTYEVKLRFPEDYYFISEVESILGYEREEIFNEIIFRHFEKKIDEIRISERDEHRFKGESLKALVKRFLRGDLPHDLHGYIERKLRGKLTVYQGIQLFKEQVRMFKDAGLTRPPEIEKVLDVLDELERDSSAVGFCA